jgi:hypothetical protein
MQEITQEVKHRDWKLSPEEMIQGIREAFHNRVSQDFCITEIEAAELLRNHPAEIILEALRKLGAHLHFERQRQQVWLEDEVVHTLLPKYIKDESDLTFHRKLDIKARQKVWRDDPEGRREHEARTYHR